jgi:hypothetical protein
MGIFFVTTSVGPLMNLTFFPHFPTFKWPIIVKFWTFQKASRIKLYIHEETLDIGTKVMVVICIQTL